VVSDAEMRQRLGFALRVALADKGWKPPDLARVIKVDPSTVTRWAAGESVPNLFMVKALSEALGVPPAYIYDPEAVPDYPISLEGLIRRATAEGMEEGLADEQPRKRGRRQGPEAADASAA
jgi:transcriptional regulator with XRE-family HTH domain